MGIHGTYRGADFRMKQNDLLHYNEGKGNVIWAEMYAK